MRLQCSEKGEVLSPYSHVEQSPRSSYDMHIHKELVKELNLKLVTNDSVDRVERRSSIFGHFFHIAVIDVDECL